MPTRSSILLWVMGPLLLWLSLTRPPQIDSRRAEALPTEMGRFILEKEHPIGRENVRLLGTSDVSWRTYRVPGGERVYVVVVFHDNNWKSLHPPHICIRGTNFEILEKGVQDLELEGRRLELGRILAVNRSSHQEYLSLYAFVGHDFLTHSYVAFYWHHAPLALLRRSTSGCLIRVETYVGEDGLAAAEERCKKMFGAMLPAAEGLIGR